MYKTIRNSHFDLTYHLVLVTKHRHKVITGGLAEELKKYVLGYFDNNKAEVYEYNDDGDHIRILFAGRPNMNLSHFVNGLKTNSSRHIQKKYTDELKNYYWKPYFWSNSYFVGTVSEQSYVSVKHYIQNQKD